MTKFEWYERFCHEIFFAGGGSFAPHVRPHAINTLQRIANGFFPQNHEVRPFVRPGTVISFVKTDWIAVKNMHRAFMAKCCGASVHHRPKKGDPFTRSSIAERQDEAFKKFYYHQKWLRTPALQRVPVRDLNADG